VSNQTTDMLTNLKLSGCTHKTLTISNHLTLSSVQFQLQLTVSLLQQKFGV